MTNVTRYAMLGLLMGAGMIAGRSEAAVVMNGTRVVYPAQEKDVTVEFTNMGTVPTLVQFWLDTGDDKSTPETAKVPFAVTPPIFRLDPDKSQAVRLVYSQEPLPTDKETLFWANMLEVPPKSTDDGKNRLEFAFRTRIKLFFRPAGLPGDPRSAPQQLGWKLVDGKGGKGVALQVSNPTPYYVNFLQVGLKVGDRLLPQKEGKGGMVAPGGVTTFPISELTSRPAGNAQAQVQVIFDSGAKHTLTRPLSP
jgi:chaperone protein EcpD